MTPRALAIFNEWFDKYKDQETGRLTRQSSCKLLLDITLEDASETDHRITGIFDQYAKKDETKMSLDREEFLNFWYTNGKDPTSMKAVYENLDHQFIRKDLKKLKDVEEETAFAKHQMPRFTLSERQDQFDKLMDLLNRNDETSQDVWNLIRSLATN